MTQASEHTSAPRPAYSICREWRQVHLKAAYDVSMLDEHDEDGTARISDIAEATKSELESDLDQASIETGDDVGAVLGIALCVLQENNDAERVSRLIRIAKSAVYHLGDAAPRSAA